MGFGTAIAASANLMREGGMNRGNALTAAGYGFDAFSSWRNSRDAEALAMRQLSTQIALQQAAANMAAQEQDYNNRMRERLLGQTSAFANALDRAVANMDPRATVSEADILNEEERLLDMYNPLLEEGIDKIVSTQYAADLNRGRDAMPTLQRKRARDMVREIGGDVARHQEAVRQSALGNIIARADAINRSRQGTLDEVRGVNLAQFDAERQLLGNTPDYGTPLASGAGLYDTLARGASGAAYDSGQTLDDALQYLRSPRATTAGVSVVDSRRSPTNTARMHHASTRR